MLSLYQFESQGSVATPTFATEKLFFDYELFYTKYNARRRCTL